MAEPVTREELAEALREMVHRCAPYLHRKKMTPRTDCSALNAAYDGACAVLNRLRLDAEKRKE